MTEQLDLKLQLVGTSPYIIYGGQQRCTTETICPAMAARKLHQYLY